MESMIKLLIIKIRNQHRYFHHHDQLYQYLLNSQIDLQDPIEIGQAHSRVVARRVRARYKTDIQNTIGVNIQTRDCTSSRYVYLDNPSSDHKARCAVRAADCSPPSLETISPVEDSRTSGRHPESNCWRKSIRSNGFQCRHSGRWHDRRPQERWLGKTGASIASGRQVSSRGTEQPLPRGSLATASGSAAIAGCRRMTSCCCDRWINPDRSLATSTSRSRHPATTNSNIHRSVSFDFVT